MWKTVAAAVIAAVLGSLFLARADRDRRKSRDEEQRERIEELTRKLARRLKVPAPAEEHKFLHEHASALIERAKQASSDPYLFGRLSRAADALLEASGSIFDAREPEKDRDDDDREEAALALQRHYFRVQQADYFAGMSRENDSELYIKHARSLYQQGRGAYDAQQYRRARKLGEAASRIVGALENLAQAAVRIPEPPRLK